MSTTRGDHWQGIAHRKREERDSNIPSAWRISVPRRPFNPLAVLRSSDIFSAQDLSLTDPIKDATSLLGQLARQEITSRALVTAFCKRAAVAQQLTNCLSEIMFSEAIERAQQLDAAIARSGKPVGPLHGLPISIKDSFHIAGYDSSVGITSYAFKPQSTTSAIVKILTGYGAIVIAKTTVPQTMLTADTDSVVFGRTCNAHGSLFGAAGSSGGEGALIAMGGSAFGVGSDGAGSVRMPAAVNGVVGYKPSGYRIPLDGVGVFDPGLIGTSVLGPVSVSGFLARTVRDVQLVARLTAAAEPWRTDPFIIPHPWTPVNAKRLRIGIWRENGFLHLQPPVLRGFQMAQARLCDAGYDLVEFRGPRIDHVWEDQKLWTEIQNLTSLRKTLTLEPHTEIVKATGIISPDDKRPALTVEHVRDMNIRLSRLLIDMVSAWQVEGDPIDALLWVAAPHTAVPFDKYTYLGFTGLFNMIDWPALALPLGLKADKEIDLKAGDDFHPYNELDASLQTLYDPEIFRGLPLSVQLIGRRFDDQKLLAIAEQIEPVITGDAERFRSKLA